MWWGREDEASRVVGELGPHDGGKHPRGERRDDGMAGGDWLIERRPRVIATAAATRAACAKGGGKGKEGGQSLDLCGSVAA